MHRLKIAEPTVEECGGRVVRTVINSRGDVAIDNHRRWQIPLSSDEVNRLTKDRKQMNRRARRGLAAKRRYRLERKRIIRQRHEQAMLHWDFDGDGKLSRTELSQMLSELVSKAPPSDADLDALMTACSAASSRPQQQHAGSVAQVVPHTPPAMLLTPAEALKALRRYDIAVSDVASVVSLGMLEVVANISDLDDFEELLEEEKREARAAADGSLVGGVVGVRPEDSEGGERSTKARPQSDACCTVM